MNTQIQLKSRFSELTESDKKAVLGIETMIKSQISTCESINEQEISGFLESAEIQLSDLKNQVWGISNILEQDSLRMEALKQTVKEEMHQLDIATRIIDAEQNGPCSLKLNNVYSSLKYLWKKTIDFQERITLIQQKIIQLEEHVSASINEDPRIIANTLSNQHNTFLHLLHHVAQVQEQVNSLKTKFSNLNLRQKSGITQLKDYANVFLAPY